MSFSPTGINKQNFNIKNNKLYTLLLLHSSILKSKVGERNKSIILDLIAENNYRLTTNDLTRITKLHRDTIYSNCKELMDRDYINKSGKYGTYYLTLKSFNKPNLRGLNFAREAITKTIKKQGTSFKTTKEEQQILLKLLEKYLEIKWTLVDNENNNDNHNETKESDNPEWYNNVIQKEIISFSVLIGAYITYVFLQARNPDNWIFFLDQQNGGKNKKKWEKGMQNITDPEKDEVLRLWLKNSINPSYLFTIFKKLNVIKRNEHDFERLIKSYEKVFPDLFKQFVDINKKMNEPESERSEEEIYDEGTIGYHESLDRKKK